MNLPAQIAGYVAVLRKHVVLLVVSMALVGAAGGLFLWRQAPLYEASAKIIIETPRRSAMGDSRGIDFFAIDSTDLNTELLLLRDDFDLAERVVERLEREHGVDTAAAGYSAGSLPGRVQVSVVPGTRLVQFSLSGVDQASLAMAVNTYVEEYSAQSEGESAVKYAQQVREFERSEAASETALQAAERARAGFVKQNPEVNFLSIENAKDAEWRALTLQSVQWDEQEEDNRQLRAAIIDALAQLGVSVREDQSGLVLESPGEPPTLHERLASDEVIAGLAPIRENSEIARLAKEEATARDEDLSWELRGVSHDAPERRPAREQLQRARDARGSAVSRTLLAQLIDIERALSRIERGRGRLQGAQKGATATNQLLSQYRELTEDVDRCRRTLEQVAESKSAFTSRYLVSDDGAQRAGPSRRVDIRVPARGAYQIAPNKPLIIALTLVAALGVGIGLVLLFEYLDDTLKSREDFDRYVGLPFLGFIPHIAEKDAANRDLASEAKPGSVVAEAFRAVRTSVLLSRADKPVRSILITSAGPGEGKTTVAVNLAATLAKHKAPVLVIDADLRRPRVAKALGISNEIGLTNVLIGDGTLEDCVQETSVEGLYALTSGPVPPNPAELLHSERLVELLGEILEKYDRLVIDSPPVIAVTDARVLVQQVDGLYLVISMGKTSWRLIQRAVESITSLGYDVQGAILNNLTMPAGRYGYYYYREYGYGSQYYRQPDEEDAGQ